MQSLIAIICSSPAFVIALLGAYAYAIFLLSELHHKHHDKVACAGASLCYDERRHEKSSAGQGTASAKNPSSVSASSRGTLRTAGSSKANCAVCTVRSYGKLKPQPSPGSPEKEIMPLTRIKQVVHLPIVGGTASASGTGCQLIDLVNDQGFGEPPCDPGCAATQGFQEMMATTEAELPGQEGATASTLSPYSQQDDDVHQVILPCLCDDPLSTSQVHTAGDPYHKDVPRTSMILRSASATASVLAP